MENQLWTFKEIGRFFNLHRAKNIFSILKHLSISGQNHMVGLIQVRNKSEKATQFLILILTNASKKHPKCDPNASPNRPKCILKVSPKRLQCIPNASQGIPKPSPMCPRCNASPKYPQNVPTVCPMHAQCGSQ